MASLDHKLSSYFDRYRREWDINARVDSMWSVLSFPEKMGRTWNEHDFYRVGEQEVDEVWLYFKEHSVALPRTGKCLDFGSGLGRITESLSSYFRTVVGVDISKSMVESARAHAVASNRLNIEYVLGSDTSLESLGWGSFDFIYTNITLQHLNNDMQKDYIRQFGLLLKSGALAVVQIPSKRPSVSFIDSIVGALKQVGLKNLAALAITSFKEGIAPWKIKMELNILSEAEVEEAARKSDLTIIRRAYIDWETFYETLKFSLLEAPRPGRSRYPTSPLYFMRKV